MDETVCYNGTTMSSTFEVKLRLEMSIWSILTKLVPVRFWEDIFQIAYITLSLKLIYRVHIGTLVK